MNLAGYDPILDDLFRVEGDKQKAAGEAERRKADRLLAATRQVLATDAGLVLLSWLIGRTGVFASSFTGNNTTFYLEGRRSVGLDLYRLLMTAEPETLHRLVTFLREEQAHARPDS